MTLRAKTLEYQEIQEANITYLEEQQAELKLITCLRYIFTASCYPCSLFTLVTSLNHYPEGFKSAADIFSFSRERTQNQG